MELQCNSRGFNDNLMIYAGSLMIYYGSLGIYDGNLIIMMLV